MQHIPDTNGAPYQEIGDERNRQYLTLIEKRDGTQLLTVVDNVIDGEVKVFVIDLLKTHDIDMEWFLRIVTKWFYESSGRIPLSFEFHRYGVMELVQQCYRSIPLRDVTKIVGSLFAYQINSRPRIKKRKIKNVTEGHSIKLSK